jgi:predicted transcriptional regulator
MTENADPILIATTQIVTAWLGAHAIASAALPSLIRDVHRALAGRELDRPDADGGAPAKAKPPVKERFRQAKAPAVDVQRSVFADHLICLEDGKSFKTLARHLNETHGMTPEQYRTKWDLPANYPMMAPDYSKLRSRLSKASGLGKRR